MKFVSVTIDDYRANTIFRNAIDEVLNEGWQPNSQYSNEVNTVILGTHKTYRYILINGLLAKATNELCNPVALQAGSNLDGAFDARSLCHGVVVPIERELLGGRLGASNEPFLNKPARFTELSLSNAVRRGNDSRILETTIKILSNIKTSEQAYILLKDAIYYIFHRESRNISDYLADSEDGFHKSSLVDFANDLVNISVEGETCALLVGVTFDIIGIAMRRNFEVKTHKVNQAGSSSKEVSDIDVYENGLLLYTAEVKDKQFLRQDVDHAVSKVAMMGHNSLIFIKGPRGYLRGDTEDQLTNFYKNKSFSLYFFNIIDFFTSNLSLAPTIDKNQFLELINHHADSAKVKDETFKHLAECARRQGW